MPQPPGGGLQRRALLLLAGFGLGAGVGSVGRRGLSSVGAAEGPLRPPGASSEAEFLAACIRCGQCVAVCPVGALQSAGPLDLRQLATPSVEDPRAAPCNLCQGHDDLLCIEACPTTALQPVDDWSDVRMGMAVIDRDRCLPWHGTTCRACWHACPFPNEAIKLDWRTRPEIIEEACVGCGLCAHVCLTEPGSIEIKPISQWRAGDATFVGGEGT